MTLPPCRAKRRRRVDEALFADLMVRPDTWNTMRALLGKFGSLSTESADSLTVTLNGRSLQLQRPNGAGASHFGQLARLQQFLRPAIVSQPEVAHDDRLVAFSPPNEALRFPVPPPNVTGRTQAA